MCSYIQAAVCVCVPGAAWSWKTWRSSASGGSYSDDGDEDDDEESQVSADFPSDLSPSNTSVFCLFEDFWLLLG